MAVRLRELGADAREIEADRVAVRPQHLEVRSGAAAAIKNARPRHARGRARERRLHVLAEAAKPEVRLFRPIGQFE